MTTTTTTIKQAESFGLRHTVATLAYRAAKVVRDSPPEFSGFRAGEGARSAGEILAHMSDLLDWALSLAKGEERWNDSVPNSWSEDSARFFDSMTRFDEYLASGAPLHTPAEKLFQGAIADALTHVGQLAMMRRLAGAPIKAENYCVANIETGRTGIIQNAPVAEFG
jgi:hypothetical protein